MRPGDSYVKPGGTGIATANVPEPTTLLLGLGLAGIAGLKLRK